MQLPRGAEELDSLEGQVDNVARANAYLLEYKAGRYVAFPPHTGMELVENPHIVRVPGVPAYCLGLMQWQGHRLPVLDLGKLVWGGAGDATGPIAGHVLVVAYQSAPGRPLEYGAVRAPFLINIIGVVDSQKAGLPSDVGPLGRACLACFEHQGQAVPILSTTELFSRPLA